VFIGGNQTDIKHSVNVNSVKILKERGHLEHLWDDDIKMGFTELG
jgi:hypothetical protein